jgi:hypothetical protein
MQCSHKVIVFDLDETLGYFSEFGMLWDAITHFIKINKISIPDEKILFNKTLDLYPEFLRPHIFNILDYLKQKKHSSHCKKVIIYTNNQGPRRWAHQIKQYFEEKLKYPLFDQVIAAFKVNGKIVELGRTSNDKLHTDLLRCSKIPEHSHICFLDDVFHPGMQHPNIYYIHLRPYKYDLSFKEMIHRFVSANLLQIPHYQLPQLANYLWTYLNRYNFHFTPKSKLAQQKDQELSMQILNHFHVFFSQTRTNKIDNKKMVLSSCLQIPKKTDKIWNNQKHLVKNKTQNKRMNTNRRKTKKTLIFNG